MSSCRRKERDEASSRVGAQSAFGQEFKEADWVKLRQPEWTAVLSYLETKELIIFCEVSRLCSKLASSDQLWKRAAGGVIVPGLSSKEVHKRVVEERKAALQEHDYWKPEIYARYACGIGFRPHFVVYGEHQVITKDLAAGVLGGFRVHPDSSRNLTLDFTLSLEALSDKMLEFEDLVSHPCYSNFRFLDAALHRYERFLKLKLKYPSLFLVPTLDIEMVWRSHLLRPFHYVDDCLRLGRGVAPHHIQASREEEALRTEAARATADLWLKEYNEPYTKWPIPEVFATRRYAEGTNRPTDLRKRELFWTDGPCLDFRYPGRASTIFLGNPKPLPPVKEGAQTHAKFTTETRAEWVSWLVGQCKTSKPVELSLSVSDLVKDRAWLQLFRDSDSRDNRFETPSRSNYVKAYERFLYLSLKYPAGDNQLSHPTYAIDLIWHTHMLHPIEYNADMLRWMGCSVDHVPWPDLSEQTMERALKSTEQHWREEFGVEMRDDQGIRRVWL